MLRRVQGNAYDAGEAVPTPAAEVQVVQGMLESSNIQGVSEMTRMIETLRAYQSVQKMAEQEHERQRRAISSLISNS